MAPLGSHGATWRKPAFREVLGPGTEAYADLLVSLLIGVTFARQVARTGALAQLTREELIGYLIPAIRALLAPAIAAAKGSRQRRSDAYGGPGRNLSRAAPAD